MVDDKINRVVMQIDFAMEHFDMIVTRYPVVLFELLENIRRKLI